eukprot:TRINITY_DN21284_c0_g1_i1.p1 TRINITY_DN21284_c0_g1~~TRINITY_DN21284_c0_g1_i1.p1  ORF type:complete len:261 (-),score=38.29 TRINITY_DN21284_c0_g1_i1:176-958(-)
MTSLAESYADIAAGPGYAKEIGIGCCCNALWLGASGLAIAIVYVGTVLPMLGVLLPLLLTICSAASCVAATYRGCGSLQTPGPTVQAVEPARSPRALLHARLGVVRATNFMLGRNKRQVRPAETDDCGARTVVGVPLLPGEEPEDEESRIGQDSEGQPGAPSAGLAQIIPAVPLAEDGGAFVMQVQMNGGWEDYAAEQQAAMTAARASGQDTVRFRVDGQKDMYEICFSKGEQRNLRTGRTRPARIKPLEDTMMRLESMP